MPDVWDLRQAGVGFPLRLFDLRCGPRFTLVAFPEDGDSPALAALTSALSAEFPDLIESVAILAQDGDRADIEGVTVVRGDRDAIGSAFGGTPPALVLVRPDGHVGFIGSITPEPLRVLLRRMLGDDRQAA